jgi:hypothetical protein
MGGNKGGRSLIFVKIGDPAMVERIRSLLAQFPEDEAAVRDLVGKMEEWACK